jgi:hypothetical protein
MKRILIGTLFLGALITSGCATPYYYGAEVNISSAPPPPPLHFGARPHYSVVHGVWVIDRRAYGSDCDVFAYGGNWYAYSGGYWYRAPSYDGPYVAVEVRRVPSRIFQVPERHWKHHPHGGPPGQTKRHGRHG